MKKMESYSRKIDEKMETFLQKNTDSVGTQLHGMNSTSVKTKEEDDRYKQISERITNGAKKILDIDEKYENRSDEPRGAHGDQNQGKAVITGFHSETSESEVIQLLKETIIEIGMTIENVRIECTAKPITYAFIHFMNDDERNKYIRSANMLKKELRGRKLKITRSMDAEERFPQKRLVCVKYCIHVKHNIPLGLITTNWTLKHVSVKGQIVVKKHAKTETLSTSNTKTSKQKSKVKWKNGNQKTHRNDCEQSREETKTKR